MNQSRGRQLSDERALKSKEKGARATQRFGKIECCVAIKTSSGAMFENNLFSGEREVNGKMVSGCRTLLVVALKLK